jgi:hypothetical protein
MQKLFTSKAMAMTAEISSGIDDIGINIDFRDFVNIV